jgi:GWxTD domain-containing protein
MVFLICSAYLQAAVRIPLSKPSWFHSSLSGGQKPIQGRNAQVKGLSIQDRFADESWLDSVRWIITDAERAAFQQLSNDEEREQFIELFWQRRDPTPDTIENEFKDEHYRRLVYANEQFAGAVPGWKTDRGRIYVMHGPADQIETDPAGFRTPGQRSEGTDHASSYPLERWRYRYLEEIGHEVELEFVDVCRCGDFRLRLSPAEKDAILWVPGDISLEQKNGANRPDPMVFIGPVRWPAIKFKNLEEVLVTKINYHQLPFEVRNDFVKITNSTTMVPITIRINEHDVTRTDKEGNQRMAVQILGRIRMPAGRIVETFEDTVDENLRAGRSSEMSHLYWRTFALRPGHYRLELVLRDVSSDRVGTWRGEIAVPTYPDDKLATSSLILADRLENLSSKTLPISGFLIGSTRIRPRVGFSSPLAPSFHRDEQLSVWMQAYSLAVDGHSHKPSATIECSVVDAVANRPALHLVETTEQLNSIGEQITLRKSFPLNDLEPGKYRVLVKVTDKIRKQNATASADFSVE